MIVIFCFGIIVIYNYRDNFDIVRKREKGVEKKICSASILLAEHSR